MTVTIELPADCRVECRHIRSADGGTYGTQGALKKMGLAPLPKGGTTEIRILRGDEELAVGVAMCRYDENFNHRLGRTIAFGRALKALQDST